MPLDSLDEQQALYKSSCFKPVRLARRANIFGPISSSSWNAKTTSGQLGRANVRWDPDCRLVCQPIFRRAASTRRALADGQLLTQLERSRSGTRRALHGAPSVRRSLVRPGPAHGRRPRRGQLRSTSRRPESALPPASARRLPVRVQSKTSRWYCNIRASCLTTAWSRRARTAAR